MKAVNLIKTNHNFKIGDKCPYTEPNISEDCILVENDKPVGFFIKKMPEKLCKIADLANYELRSENVPKSMMGSRMAAKGYDENGKGIYDKNTQQYSTIIGSVPPRPMMRRPYPQISSVHQVKSATNFIKAMLLLVNQAENIIADIMPEQYKIQLQAFKNVDEKWKFGKLFTSSISNYNINADYHIDSANIKNTVNVIITKRLNSKGGNLNVPDYGATFDQCDNSMLVYPAWRNMHGVTPIIPSFEGGYRNSLVFYPLKAFYKEFNND
jgi:hypothetical protein